MYALRVQRALKAFHFLVGADWGAENHRHSHDYAIELIFEGPTLNEHGYLLDIVEVERALDREISRYHECTLNDLEEFQGLNPSIEHFAHILWGRLKKSISPGSLQTLTVRVWEDQLAWSQFRAPLNEGEETRSCT